VKLTNGSVKALPVSTDRQVYVYDDALPGFGVRVSPGGKKSYFVQYRTKGRSKKRKTLGSATILSAEVARDRAKELLARIALGEDPNAEPPMTFAAAFEEFHTNHLAYKSPSYRNSAEVIWKHHVPAKLKNRLLTDLTRHDLLSACERIVAAGKLPTATLALDILKAMFARLEDRQVIQRSPLHRARLAMKPSCRTRVLSDDELRAVWFSPGLRPDELTIVRLLILTGCRRCEILELRPSEVSRGALRLEGARLKNRHDHTLPLPDVAVALLKAHPTYGVARVFAPRTPGRFMIRVRRASGVTCNLHDLRRTFATNLARLKVPPHVIERSLNHFSKAAGNSGIASVYNQHVYSEELGEALALHANWLMGLVDRTKEAA